MIFTMKYFRYLIIFSFFVLVFLACSPNKYIGVSDTIDLPEGTDYDTAVEIALAIYNDGYKEKISNKFSELSEEDLNGLYVHGTRFTMLTGDKKQSVYISIGIKFSGNVEQGKKVVEFGKSIGEQYIKKYFASKD